MLRLGSNLFPSTADNSTGGQCFNGQSGVMTLNIIKRTSVMNHSSNFNIRFFALQFRTFA
jgi:hypothetical protein